MPEYNDRSQYELEGKELDDFLDHRHKLAKQHFLAIKGEADAEKAQEQWRKQARRKAAKLLEKANKLREEAEELDWQSRRPYYDLPQEVKDKFAAIEDAGYWAARRAIKLG